MRQTSRIDRNSLPATIIRHLEQSGLGWGSENYPNSFWIKTDQNRKRR